MTSTTGQETVLPTTIRGWRDLLSHLGVRPSKGMGQNFLFERGVVRKIVDEAGIDRNSTIVEIGPGLGIMTEELLSRAGKVIAIELDTDLANHLKRLFGDRENFDIYEGDALQIDLGTLATSDRPYQVVANLPYSVASAIIRHALEATRPPQQMTVMVQKEVAERIAASPPHMSILGVAAQFYATPRIAFTVTADVFFPRPDVESAVLDLVPRSEALLPMDQRETFFRVVNAGFRQKRKQVANSLSAELVLPKPDMQALLLSSGIDPSRRAETISVEEWVRLSQAAAPKLDA
jgi:16S rRNA (adenine1518-N6/adenine1519-N6)-dimethyltransferase